MKSVGIDVGSSSIKVVEVQSTSKGVVVTQFVEHPLGTNPAHDQEIEILEFIRGLSSTYDQSTRFVVSLKQERVSVRNKIFPFNDRQKILKSLPFELEEDLPISAENAVFDAKIVRYLGETAEVLACATPKARVASALQIMSDAGMEISLLSAEGVAFANCLENWDQAIPQLPAPQLSLESDKGPPRKIRLVLYIGHQRTFACAFENNLLIGMRTILWGGKQITDAIARRYEIPYVEALKEMQTKAFILPTREGASYDQLVFSDTISNQVKDLARELKISILEFQSEFNGQVESVSMTGGASQILNLNAFLTQQLELPVNKLITLAHFNSVQFERTNLIDSKIGVALGLALEGLKKPRNPAISFLKGEFAKQNTSMKIFWERWSKILQIGAAALVIFFIYSIARDSLSLSLADRAIEQLKVQAKTVAKLPAKQQTDAGVKKFIREQKKHSMELKTVEGLAKMNSALDILKKVNDAIPSKSTVSLDLRKFAVIQDQVVIEGVLTDPRQLPQLEAALATVALGPVSRGNANFSMKKNGTPFALSFKVDRGIQTQ